MSTFKQTGFFGRRRRTHLEMQTGMHREQLDNLQATTDLAKETIKNMKNEIWKNIIYIVLGVVIGYLPTLLSEDKTTKAIESLNISISEKNALEIQNQIEFRKMRSELSSLKSELDSLKVQ